VRALVLAAALFLSGCSANEFAHNWTGGPIPDLSEPNYRRIVTDNIRSIFPKENPPGELEISRLRMVEHLKGPAWLTCLKIDARASVVMDQCQKESYGPFELPGKKPET